MRRAIGFGVVWLAAAAAALTVAWQGVGVVGDQVTDRRPAPLAAADIEARLAATTTTSPTPAAATPSTIPPESTVGTTTPTQVPAPSTPTTTAPAVAPAGTTPPVQSETRTYSLQGGTASLRYSPAGVEVVFANPAAGYTVDVEPEHGNGVTVEFESEAHESRVDGWWEGGPVDRVREEPRD
ncbi:MAG TPA: hypothetical protein VFV35_06245 [Acidimicrobiales bacterium]|nr:hypothetical protein [Acidimicrobiales bacterium]